MAFFFSAVGTKETRKGKRKSQTKGQEEHEYSGEESNDEAISSSQVAGTTTPDWISEHRSIVDKKLCPAVVYWIALTTPNGALATPLTVHRALHECGVETLASQVRQIILY